MTGPKHNNEDFKKQVTEVIEANLHNERFGVSELSRIMGMERSTLHRRTIKAINASASQYICQVKLKKALKLLQESPLTISETAFESGFHSVTYFSKCFHNYFGFPPGEAKNKLTTSKNFLKKDIKIEIKQTTLFRSLLIVPALIVISFILTNKSALDTISFNKEAETTLAVLPIEDLNREEGDELYMNGLQNEIIKNLRTIGFITIILPPEYRKEEKKLHPVHWAKKLKINYLIEGTSLTINNQMKIRFLMTDIKTGKIIWSGIFSSDLTCEDAISFQPEISQTIGKEIKATFINLDSWSPDKNQ